MREKKTSHTRVHYNILAKTNMSMAIILIKIGTSSSQSQHIQEQHLILKETSLWLDNIYRTTSYAKKQVSAKKGLCYWYLGTSFYNIGKIERNILEHPRKIFYQKEQVQNKV